MNESVADSIYPPIQETPEQINLMVKNGQLNLYGLIKAIDHYQRRIGALVTHGIEAPESQKKLLAMQQILQQYLETERARITTALTRGQLNHASIENETITPTEAIIERLRSNGLPFESLQDWVTQFKQLVRGQLQAYAASLPIAT